MAVTSGTSFLISIISTILIFSGMQMYKPWLTSSQVHTIFGGYLGSILFVFSLTALGNLETYVFGKTFQVKIFPEVSLCLVFSLLSSAMIHRVCATTSVLISLAALYYLNRYSQKVHTVQPQAPITQISKKKK